MKKLFLSLVAVIVAATATYAQSSLVATLSHKGEISVFHGASSLKQAMEVADHGDIITLASGRYEAANITKAIILRGAGMEEDAITGAFGTQIIGNFYIILPDSISENLSIEGIRHNGTISLDGKINNAMFQKSWFNSISGLNNGQKKEISLTLIHCRIDSSFRMLGITSVNIISCILNDPSNDVGYMEFTNCIISGRVDGINNSLFTNCLFCTQPNTWWTILSKTNIANYCAATGAETLFQSINKLTNKNIESGDDFRAAFNALFKPDKFYELTDEAKGEYVGQDGKEMGIYGGNLPYESRILSPQITKCNVAAKTTADGKLSVDIEVKAAE